MMKEEEPGGILDSFWAIFLQDYDHIDDDRNSVGSSVETLSFDEYESFKEGRSDIERENPLIDANSKDEKELKMSILLDSLRRSNDLLTKMPPRHRTPISHESEDIDKSRLQHNTPEHEYLESFNFKKTEPQHRTQMKIKRMETGRHADLGREPEREEPPKTIFIDAQSDVAKVDRTARATPKYNIREQNGASDDRNAPTELTRRQTEESPRDDQGGNYDEYLQPIEEESNEMDLKAAQRKELIRKIALLRIRAKQIRNSRGYN